MTKKLRYTMFCIVTTLIAVAIAWSAEDVSTYLIMGDIPPYQRVTQVIDMITEKLKTIPGYSVYDNFSGTLAGADHFSLDHTDTTYETDYQSDALKLGANVQVTRHAGGESDKWLLHEIEDRYRDGDDSDGRLVLLSGAGVKIRE